MLYFGSTEEIMTTTMCQQKWDIRYEQTCIITLNGLVRKTGVSQKLKERAQDTSNGSRPFFLAFGAKKPHLPFYFPEEYLKYYPEESIEMPYNPNCPVDMPNIAWHKPSVLGYDDCSAEAIGIPELGHINVTYPDSKVCYNTKNNKTEPLILDLLL